jgi:hypothetical protein|tara:strand:- start:3464 stop:5038 length:1575 start_codon:yes stop_codon:yes gene_type:complete
MSFSLTKEQILKEVLKSGKDPVYFINNYAKISHPMRGLIPFKTYDFQTDLISDFNDHRFTVILKARQLGISTITAAYVAWMMMFHRDKNVLVIATKFGTAANLVKKVKAIHKHLPEWMKIASIFIDNRTSFELTNGSQIKASSTSSDAGRSEALSLLVIDEAAHVEGLDDLWTGLYPTLSTGGRCIALSTPNGVGNWFHQTCVDAEIEKNDFRLIGLPWHVHPDRDQEWFEKETKNMSRRQIAQELECNFNMSGETVFHPEDMQLIEQGLCEPKYKTAFDRNLWIWEEFQPGATYMISADVARGDGKDYSTFHVFNIKNSEIVAEYQGKPTPDVFAEILCQAGKEYGECMLVVENNSVGWGVLTRLEDLEYGNLYYSRKSSHEHVEPYLSENAGVVPGFTTSSKTRPLTISKLEELIRNKLITIKSKRLFSEMKTFIWDNGRPQAMRKHNDDLIMACAIGCWVKETVYNSNQRGVEYKKAFITSMGSTGSKLNTSISGMLGYKEEKGKNQNKKNYKDFIWLIKG